VSEQDARHQEGKPQDKKHWDSSWIRSVLPHRYPFLLVDRVLEMEPGKRIVALKNVTINEEFFVGHFPNHPVMPGVLIIEAMAQAAGVLLVADLEDRASKLLYFMGIDRARFRRPVVPGDQLRFEIEVLRLRKTFCKVDAKALVDGRLVAEAVLSSGIVDADG
jgi:beta-hydroxyacyl-ACP dehydratase FabZ